MKLSNLKSHDEVHARRLERDPVYAAETARLDLAHAVSVAVVKYRTERGRTQRAFAAKMGWKQPQVARLERGDVTPSWETLERLARAEVLEVHLDRLGTAVRELASA